MYYVKGQRKATVFGYALAIAVLLCVIGYVSSSGCGRTGTGADAARGNCTSTTQQAQRAAEYNKQAGATVKSAAGAVGRAEQHADNFNPRSLAGATAKVHRLSQPFAISIHAPSRERPHTIECFYRRWKFQSTLPRGSDRTRTLRPAKNCYFNPRSLAGATPARALVTVPNRISIHAPSRERLHAMTESFSHSNFNPRSLAGATL